jgi:glycosyltransferase involved in cell wall biosynthesis
VRVAEILLRPGIGGAETLSRALSDYWRSCGHVLVTMYVDPDGEGANRYARIRRIRKELRRFEPDVVHSHSALPNLYSRLAAVGRYPVVTVLHSAAEDFSDRGLRWSEKALQCLTSAVIAVSVTQQNEYKVMVSRGRLPVLIPNGIRDDIRTRSSPRTVPSRGVAIGRIAQQKRLDVLINAWRLARMDEWTLAIAGEGTDRALNESIVALVAERQDGVTLLGPVRDVPGLLDACDLFVHAADREAHPLAPLEAAAAGLPIIVSQSVARTLPAGLPAAVFDDGNAESLAAALHVVRGNFCAFAAEAVRLSGGIRDIFSIGRCAALHLQVLEKAVADGQAGHAFLFTARTRRRRRDE